MTSRYFLTIVFILLFALVPGSLWAVGPDLGGRIVLQVEDNGEAWYIGPGTRERYYLGRPSDAFALMREKGLGISDRDLRRIPVGLGLAGGPDSDKDGLPDELEKSLGSNPGQADSDGDSYADALELSSGNNLLGPGPWPIDKSFASRHSGRIFLQVESRGEAWYIFPGDSKRYFLGRPADAFAVMKSLGLGISNADLDKLVALTPNFSLTDFENLLHDLVNQEREKNGLKALKYNAEVSAVARRHSQDLADENREVSALDSFCSFPLIHHEGTEFGIYQDDRLSNSGIRYFRMSGENIALLSSASITLTYREGSVNDSDFDACEAKQEAWDSAFKLAIDKEKDEAAKIRILEAEIAKRKKAFAESPRLKIGDSDWKDMETLARDTVDGWMGSPGHRKNILQGEYDEAGMGAAYANSYIISTQVFITRTACGYVGAPCCEKGDYLVCYEPNSCKAGTCVAD